MRTMLIILAAAFFLIGGWFVAWNSIMAADVAVVKAAIKDRHDAIKSVSRHTTFKADDVAATGFPFAFKVAIYRPTLTQITQGETYAISFEKLELARANESRFEVRAPQSFDSMYATPATPPNNTASPSTKSLPSGSTISKNTA